MAKVLVTGANGFVGKRLIISLLNQGHQVYALCRIRGAKAFPDEGTNLSYIFGDLRNPKTYKQVPVDLDAAYYLVHSMTEISTGLVDAEIEVANCFIAGLKQTKVQQIIYLGGIIDDVENLSLHLKSRLLVENVLRASNIPTTVLRASVIIGAGSASFEIIRDLCEKLPLMIAPRWVHTLCQPIGISDVLFYLSNVLLNPKCYHQTFDIGGPEIFTFKDLLLKYTEFRQLKLWIIDVPFLTPRLSSYWLVLITSVKFSLCSYLVDSMRYSSVVKSKEIDKILPHQCLSFEEALKLAFQKISENQVASSWMDAWEIPGINPDLADFIKVPEEGCFIDRQCVLISDSKRSVINRIWGLGGDTGYYALNWAWSLRGLLDQLVGGVGLNRGRRHPTEIQPGDSIDFWRVILADKEQGHLILYAEMKVPGEAWLEFKIKGECLIQTATFRPRGIQGRLYWYLFFPFHFFIFKKMAKAISGRRNLGLIDRLLDLMVVFSFDKTGFKRHCTTPIQLGNFKGKNAIVTGASRGIGQKISETLIQQGMHCHLIARNISEFTISSTNALTTSLDMSCIEDVYRFASSYRRPALDLIIHNAGGMPDRLRVTSDGYEEMFASQVLGPYVLTKTLIDAKMLNPGCRVIFVSSGGMYLKKMDLSDLSFKTSEYNKYTAYANVKRAQVILAELFAKRYPHYLFSAMHPGWVNTPGVKAAMPMFFKIMRRNLRTLDEGIDTLLWLAMHDDYPNGQFWFDRELVKPTIFGFNDSNPEEKAALWKHCEKALVLLKNNN